MKLIPLGQTGLKVTSLGLGLAALGRPGYINLGHHQDLPSGHAVDDMQAQAHRILDAAYEAGIRYFDAARSYGKAEAFLGSWLGKAGLRKEEVTVGSKWGYTYTADWQIQAEKHEIKDHSLPQLIRQWQETQSELGQNLNLYQIHSATLESGVLEKGEVLDYLAQLKGKGIAIGLSLSGPGQAKTLSKALEIRVDGQLLFDAVQATWNLLERAAEPALQEAHSAGMGVIIKEALANGRLTDRNQGVNFSKQLALLRQRASALSVGVDALAIAAALNRPWGTVVLSGAAVLDHLESNLKALSIDWTEDLEEALSVLVEDSTDYWKIRKSLEWN